MNHPEDPGGATNLGVTKRVMQEFLGRAVSMGEMKSLTTEDVKPVYKKLYVDKVRFDELPAELDWAVLDWAVNSGAGRAAISFKGIMYLFCSGSYLKRLQLRKRTGYAASMDMQRLNLRKIK